MNKEYNWIVEEKEANIQILGFCQKLPALMQQIYKAHRKKIMLFLCLSHHFIMLLDWQYLCM